MIIRLQVGFVADSTQTIVNYCLGLNSMRKHFKTFGLTLVTLAGLVTAPVVAEITDRDFEAAIGKYLKTDAGQEAIGNAIQSYSMKMREKAMTEEFERQFANPVAIDVGNSPVRGPAGAKVTIVEFSDFQCPFCSRGKNTMEEVMKKYPNDVKVAFKNLPLPMHPEAMPAAKAALAANKQGKFWEMHDALFNNQGALGSAFYEQKAKELGLNLEKFKADMNAKETEDAIKADMELGNKNGIQGTPGFFVNGIAVKGAYPVDHFAKIIDRLLTKK